MCVRAKDWSEQQATKEERVGLLFALSLYKGKGESRLQMEPEEEGKRRSKTKCNRSDIYTGGKILLLEAEMVPLELDPPAVMSALSLNLSNGQFEKNMWAPFN